MGLEEPLLGVLGSLAEGQPLLKLPPSVSSGPRGARGYSEACCSWGWTPQDKARDLTGLEEESEARHNEISDKLQVQNGRQGFAVAMNGH